MELETKNKIKQTLDDGQLKYGQKELLNKWYNHVKRSFATEDVLKNACVIKDFGLFIGKPFQDATFDDINNNNGFDVTIMRSFYKWILKYTSLKLNEEVRYFIPKIIKKEEKSTEEVCEIRVKAILNNRVISKKNEDKGLTEEELKNKYKKLLLDDKHLETLNKYHDYKFTSTDVESYTGFVSKLYFLKVLGLFLKNRNKAYKEASREDIQDFLNQKQQEIKAKKIRHGKYNPNEKTKLNSGYKAMLLDFYRFVYEMFEQETPRKYPEVVSWLCQRKKKKNNNKPKKEVIPVSEIKLMIESCVELRDKALISLLLDSSARVGEIVNANIGDVKISEVSKQDSKYKHMIATITLRGKMGTRTNQLFYSVPYLRLWLSSHPKRDDVNAPLFIAKQENRYGQRMTNCGINKILQRVAKRTGIKRNIHAHLFRHSNLTRMAQVLSEFELKKHAGWGESSNMASVYVHLTDEDVGKTILKSYGFDFKEDKTEQEEVLKSTICPNNICSYQNPGDAKFCLKCGYPLSLKTAVDLNRVKKQEEQLHNDVMNKGLANVNLSQTTDLKEVLYQVVKNDKQLLDRLRNIVKGVSENKNKQEG